MDGAFGELVAGMVDADVAIAEVDQAVVAAPVSFPVKWTQRKGTAPACWASAGT